MESDQRRRQVFQEFSLFVYQWADMKYESVFRDVPPTRVRYLLSIRIDPESAFVRAKRFFFGKSETLPIGSALEIIWENGFRILQVSWSVPPPDIKNKILDDFLVHDAICPLYELGRPEDPARHVHFFNEFFLERPDFRDVLQPVQAVGA